MKTHENRFRILVVEDDTDDCLLAIRALEESQSYGDLRFVQSGRELMHYLYHYGAYSDPRTSPRPDLILLDLNMPRMDGRQALAEIQTDPDLQHIPIVIFTSSDSPQDMSSSDILGAYEYVTKPASFVEYVQVMKELRSAVLV